MLCDEKRKNKKLPSRHRDMTRNIRTYYRLYWLGYSCVDTFWYFVVSLKAVPLFRWYNFFPHFFDIKSKLNVTPMKKSLLLVVERDRTKRSTLFPFCRNSRLAALLPGMLFLSEFRFLYTYIPLTLSSISLLSFFFFFFLILTPFPRICLHLTCATSVLQMCTVDGWMDISGNNVVAYTDSVKWRW